MKLKWLKLRKNFCELKSSYLKVESQPLKGFVNVSSIVQQTFIAIWVVTHYGVKFPCWALSDLSSFQQTLEEMLMTRTSFQYLLKKHGGKQAAWEYPFVVAWE
ncbi:hypothetical protein PS2_035410 [Malus domestica]